MPNDFDSYTILPDDEEPEDTYYDDDPEMLGDDDYGMEQKPNQQQRAPEKPEIAPEPEQPAYTFMQMNPLAVVSLIGDLAEELEQKKASTLRKAQSIFIAGIVLSPRTQADNTAKKKAAGRIAANQSIINQAFTPQVIDTLINYSVKTGIGLTEPSKDDEGKVILNNEGKPAKFTRTLLGRTVQRYPSVVDVTNYIISGLQMVIGTEIKSATDSDGHTIHSLLSQLNTSAISNNFQLREVQDTHKGVGAFDETPEERAAREAAYKQDEEMMNRVAQELSKLSQDERKQIVDEAKNEREVNEATSIQSQEDTDFKDYSAEIQKSELVSKIETAAMQIMNVYDSLFESCIALGRIFGVLTLNFDKQQGKVTGRVVRAYSENRKIYLDSSKDTASNNAIIVTDWWRDFIVKEEILPGVREIKNVARKQQVPNLENISMGINYYPHFILNYALGFVKGQRHVKWNTFRKALEQDVKDRLYKISKQKLSNGITGYNYISEKESRERIVRAFTTSALILTGDVGLKNFQVRISTNTSLSRAGNGRSEFDLQRNLEGIEVQGRFINGKAVEGPIYDLQGYISKDTFLGKPNWAYQALGRIYGGGVKPDLMAGVPIGQTVEGDLVYLQVGVDNTQIGIGLFAGSRSGKGVQTLSTLCAAYGGGAGVAYIDNKPDMATIFWDLENSHQGLHTLSLDTTDDRPRIDQYGKAHRAIDVLNERGFPDLASHSTPLLYAKALQLMTLTSIARTKIAKKTPLFWIMDELTIAQSKMKSFCDMLEKFKSEPKPLKGDATPEAKEKYVKAVEYHKWYEYLDHLRSGIETNVNATFGQANTVVMLIGQSPENLDSGKTGGTPLSALFNILNTNCLAYMAGRGLQGVNVIGTKALQRKSPTLSKLVENNRFFELRKSMRANATGDEAKNYSSTVFKPFLTVNTNNYMDACWTGGIGKTYGYDSTRPNDKQMLENYRMSLHANLGDPANPGDVVHRGTGFYGLLETYMGHIQNPRERQAATDEALSRGYRQIEEALTLLHILGDGNIFGYQTVEDFFYDLDPEKNFCSLAEVESYIETHQSGAPSSLEGGSEGGDGGYGDGIGIGEDDNSTEQQNSQQSIQQSQTTSEQSNEDNEDGDLTPVDLDEDEEEDEFAHFSGAERADTIREKLDAEFEAKDEEENDLNAMRNYQQRESERQQAVDFGTKRRKRSKNEGAVYQNTADFDPSNVDEKTGQVKIDSKIYRDCLQEELKVVDNKFSYSNKFLNRYGSARHYQERQKALISVIKSGSQTRSCETVYLGADDIVINDVSFGRCQGYGDMWYFNLLDGFDFNLFFKNFKYIKLLHLDSDAYSLLQEQLSQYGYGAIEQVFRIETSLQIVYFPDVNAGGLQKVTRDITSRAKYIKAEEKRYKEEEEAARALEESFLFGGNLNNGTGKQILRNNAKNQSRARAANSNKRTSPKARSRARQMTQRGTRAMAVGATAFVLRMPGKVFRFFKDSVREARQGF